MFDDSVLLPNRLQRSKILTVLQAGLTAVEPGQAVRQSLTVVDHLLTVQEQSYDLNDLHHIYIVGAGKASAPMTQAVETLLGERITGGFVVVKDGHSAPTQRVEIGEASHPVPDERGIKASQRIRTLAEQATQDDLVIALLSGGGSALLADDPTPPQPSPQRGEGADTGNTKDREDSHTQSGSALLADVPNATPPQPSPQRGEGADTGSTYDHGVTLTQSPITDHGSRITLTDLQTMTTHLLACGATINEINTLRKHCSTLKGGQLARAVYPARLLTLVLSDVVGSPLDVIASGPTVPDRSTWQDAWAIVEKYGLAEKLPSSIADRLQAGLAGQIADTPKPGDPIFERTQTVIIGDNRIAAQAAGATASELGYNPLILTTFLEGEASEVAKVVVALAKEVQETGEPVPRPACLILGGETTVTLGNQATGKGGRNQELALAAALRLAGTSGITIACLATDGSDGPTDSTGAMVDGGTIERGLAHALSATDHLRRHDAYPFLCQTHDLLISGPTQTNVNDLICVFVE